MLGQSYEQRDKGLIDLREAQNAFKPAAIALADAERAYRIAKATKILELRNEGQPATLIPDLVKGDEAIADLKLTRDIAEAQFKAIQSHINNLKLELRLINDEINREWNSGGIGEL